MIGIPLALLASNAFEWWVHKHVLHGAGRNKRSFWAFHWYEHHGESRKHGMLDPNYERHPIGWHAQGKELLALVGASLAITPLLPIAPFFVGTSYYCTYNYYRVHKRAHRDLQWARTHLPWHYDHHMGPNQHKNWCVTKPWFDELMGTREPYAGTAREAADLERAERRARRRSTETPKNQAPDSQRRQPNVATSAPAHFPAKSTS